MANNHHPRVVSVGLLKKLIGTIVTHTVYASTMRGDPLGTACQTEVYRTADILSAVHDGKDEGNFLIHAGEV